MNLVHAFRRAALGAALFAAFAGPAPVAAQPADQFAYTDAWSAGWRMTAEEAAAKEERLREKPDDMRARAALLGYFGANMYDSDEARRGVERHVLWLVENKPESSLAAESTLDHIGSPAVHWKCVEKYEQHLAEQPENLAILSNYADFVMHSDGQKSLELYRRCAELEPSNGHWQERIAFVAQLEAVSAATIRGAGIRFKAAGKSDEEAEAALRESALESLKALEKALELSPDGHMAKSLLGSMAKAACDAGDDEKARLYARRLLKAEALAPLSAQGGGRNTPEPDNDAIHQANTVLGLVALRAGDVEAARNHLIASAPAGGSPVLGSFGPSMRLAKAMLEAGERDAVLRYFERCEKFWDMGHDDLEEWSKLVKAGLGPSDRDFRWTSSSSR